jgi:hypothetical protein
MSKRLAQGARVKVFALKQVLPMDCNELDDTLP